MQKVDSYWSIICLECSLLVRRDFNCTAFTRDEESKNKERGGYKVEMGGIAEGNVTVDLLVTYTKIVNHSLFTINIH